MHITQCVSCPGTRCCSPSIPLKGSAAEPRLEDWIETRLQTSTLLRVSYSNAFKMSLPRNRSPLLIFLPCARIPFSTGNSSFLLWHLHLRPRIGDKNRTSGLRAGPVFPFGTLCCEIWGWTLEELASLSFLPLCCGNSHLLSAATEKSGCEKMI